MDAVGVIMREVTDPKILAQLNATSGTTEVTDPKILAQLNSQDDGTGSSKWADLADNAKALAGSSVRGSVGGLEKLGGLAADTLEYLAPNQNTKEGLQMIRGGISKGYDAVTKPLTQVQALNEAEERHPNTAAIGYQVGDAISSMMPAMKASQLMGAGLKMLPGVSSLIPNSTKIQQAFSQGNAAGIVGASQNPNDPVSGYTVGAAIGAPIGYAAEALGTGLTKNAAAINKVYDDAARAKVPLNDPEVMDAARNAVRTSAKNLTKEDVQEITHNEIIKAVNRGTPEQVKAKIDSTWEPLNKAPAVAPAENTLSLISSTEKPAMGLPQTPLNPQGNSLKDTIQFYREAQKLRSDAYNLSSENIAAYKDYAFYKDLTKAAEQDLNKLAASQGLQEQYDVARKLSSQEFAKADIMRSFKIAEQPNGKVGMTRFYKALNRLQLDHSSMWTNESKDLVKGLKKMAGANFEFAQGGAARGTPGAIKKMVDFMTTNDAAVSLIRMLGSKSITATQFRKQFNNALTGSITQSQTDPSIQNRKDSANIITNIINPISNKAGTKKRIGTNTNATKLIGPNPIDIIAIIPIPIINVNNKPPAISAKSLTDPITNCLVQSNIADITFKSIVFIVVSYINKDTIAVKTNIKKVTVLTRTAIDSINISKNSKPNFNILIMYLVS